MLFCEFFAKCVTAGSAPDDPKPRKVADFTDRSNPAGLP